MNPPLFDVQVEFSLPHTCNICGNEIHSEIWAFQEADGGYKFRLECIDCVKKEVSKSLRGNIKTDELGETIKQADIKALRVITKKGGVR